MFNVQEVPLDFNRTSFCKFAVLRKGVKENSHWREESSHMEVKEEIEGVQE